MRVPPSLLPALLLASLTVTSLAACSSPDTPAGATPAGDTAPASPAPSAAPPAADLPAPAGVLPAPQQREPSPTAPPTASSAGAAAGPSPAPPDANSAGRHRDPGAVDVVVNKQRPLAPLDFAPAGLRLPDVAIATDNALLRQDTAAAVEAMFAAAAQDGVQLVLVSGYRSFSNQESTYAYWVNQYGDAAGADTVSARPGYSEHQTGLAFDIGQADGACTLVSCFAETAAARWAAEHAAEYGIILRYPLGANGVTGFSAEPWHFRFVGREVSLAMDAAGTATLEEHFGLPPASSY
ncbi:D-alanyl-D-alanine carboxypeptidase [Arthrobacter agilis]|uniref:M15 family metallopeptidase n=1 Tax=Arthrobacter agilis TaxID=37921 RepID=UPI000F716508|nr:M15 family metallopeptidase [Arthrobacter agilis]VDR32967.1 D-alanyl-D-alanine carboxypeptidase [Arthrobacter agilis]